MDPLCAYASTECACRCKSPQKRSYRKRGKFIKAVGTAVLTLDCLPKRPRPRSMGAFHFRKRIVLAERPEGKDVSTIPAVELS